MKYFRVKQVRAKKGKLTKGKLVMLIRFYKTKMLFQSEMNRLDNKQKALFKIYPEFKPLFDFTF